MRRRFQLLELTISLCALIASVFAIVMVYEQNKILNEQNRLSTAPYVNAETNFFSNDDENAILEVLITNTGPGVAIVSDYIIFRRDGSISRDPVSVALDTLPESPWFQDREVESSVITRMGVRNEAIPSGASNLFLRVSTDDLEAQDFVADYVTQNLRGNTPITNPIYLCYCSILGDCWIDFPTEQPPKNVNSCQEFRQTSEEHYRWLIGQGSEKNR